jgi:predicted dehydrogenase
MGDCQALMDTLAVNLTFADGSIASISYFSNGNRSLAKERVEIFSGGQTVVIDDFRRMSIHSRKSGKYNLRKQDKGHHQIVGEFLSAVASGAPTPIPFEDVYWATLATFKVVESIQSGQRISL